MISTLQWDEFVIAKYLFSTVLPNPKARLRGSVTYIRHSGQNGQLCAP